MGAAREILLELLDEFRGAMPGVAFSEAVSMNGSFMPGGPVCVAGAVTKESEQGDEWSAKLSFTAYVPRGMGSAGELLDRMAELAKGSQPLLEGVERGAAAKAGGAIAEGCVLSFYKAGSSGGSGGKKVRYPISVNGRECSVTGWKVSGKDSGRALTAVGESEPFYYKGSSEFTVELQGLDLEGAGELEGFTLRLGDRRALYTGCRWKSFSAEGSGTVTAGERVDAEEG